MPKKTTTKRPATSGIKIPTLAKRSAAQANRALNGRTFYFLYDPDAAKNETQGTWVMQEATEEGVLIKRADGAILGQFYMPKELMPEPKSFAITITVDE